MRKSEFLALSGIAALCFAVSPVLTNTSSAMVLPDETVTIDYLDVTNGDATVIKDQGMSEYIKFMNDNWAEPQMCATIMEETELVFHNECTNTVPHPVLSFSTDGEGALRAMDINVADELIVYENITLDTYYLDGEPVFKDNFIDYLATQGNSKEPKLVRYNISKLFVGTGYSFISGENQTYVKGSEDGLMVHTTSNVESLVSVEVDGKKLSEADYNAENGSIVLTLKSGYMNGLNTGRHTLKINFNDAHAGEASLQTSFTIENNPETSDLPASVIVTFAASTLLSIATFGYMAISRKIRR